MNEHMAKELSAMADPTVTLVVDHNEDGTESRWYEVDVMDESLDGPIMTAKYTVKEQFLTWFMHEMGWNDVLDSSPHKIRHQGHYTV